MLAAGPAVGQCPCSLPGKTGWSCACPACRALEMCLRCLCFDGSEQSLPNSPHPGEVQSLVQVRDTSGSCYPGTGPTLLPPGALFLTHRKAAAAPYLQCWSVVCSCQDLSAFPAVPGTGDGGRNVPGRIWQQAVCHAAPPCSCFLLFAEVDRAGERVDQGRGAEVRRREVEIHLPQVPLPEPHRSDDQGSLADHEETGNALKLGATGLSFSIIVFLVFGPQFVFWKLEHSVVYASVGRPCDTKTMTDRNPVLQLYLQRSVCCRWQELCSLSV